MRLGPFHEQLEIVYLPFELNYSDALEKFANFLYKNNTPYNIFEDTNIISFKKIYAPQYLFLADFDFVTELNLARINNNGEKEGQWFTSEYSAEKMDVHFTYNSSIGEFSGLPDNFFPNFDYCINHKTKEIDSDMSTDDLLMCSNYSLTVDDVSDSEEFKNKIEEGIKKSIEQELLEKIRFNSGQKYKYFYTDKYSDGYIYNITWCTFVSTCIPLYKICYEFGDKEYTLFVNGCNISNGLFSSNEYYCNAYPNDVEKVKGLIAKISNKKEKSKHKKEQMNKTIANWSKFV